MFESRILRGRHFENVLGFKAIKALEEVSWPADRFHKHVCLLITRFGKGASFSRWFSSHLESCPIAEEEQSKLKWDEIGRRANPVGVDGGPMAGG